MSPGSITHKPPQIPAEQPTAQNTGEIPQGPEPQVFKIQDLTEQDLLIFGGQSLKQWNQTCRAHGPQWLLWALDQELGEIAQELRRRDLRMEES